MTSYVTNRIPAELEYALKNELEGGEEIRWADQPQPMRMATQMIPLCIFGLFFGGFAAFWITMAAVGTSRIPSNAPTAISFLPLFGLPFLLIGLSMICSPLFGYWAAQRTVYAVTDRRAMSLVMRRTRVVKSYHARDIDAIQRVERADGTGDVTFAHQYGTDSRGYRTTTNIGFYGIHQPHEVEQLIQAIVDGHKNQGNAAPPAAGPSW